MTDLNQLDPDAVFILMMIIGVLGVVFTYPTEIMDFLVYSIKAIVEIKIIQFAMIVIGIGGFISFIMHKIWSP